MSDFDNYGKTPAQVNKPVEPNPPAVKEIYPVRSAEPVAKETQPAQANQPAEGEPTLDPGLMDPTDFAKQSPRIAESEERQKAADEIAYKERKKLESSQPNDLASPERLSTTIPGKSAREVSEETQSMSRPRIKVTPDLGFDKADPTNQSGPRESLEGNADAYAKKDAGGSPENKSK